MENTAYTLYTFIYNNRIVKYDSDETQDEEMFSYRYFFYDVWESEASYLGLPYNKPILVSLVQKGVVEGFSYKVLD